MTNSHYNYRKPKDTWFYQFSLIAIIVLYGYSIIRGTNSLTITYNHEKLFLLILLTSVILSIIYILYQIIQMRNEYDVVDRNKEIVINDEEKKIIIRQGASETIVLNNNIECVEKYESWVAAYPLGNFEYIKLKTKTGENLIITGFTLSLIESKLSSVLKGIKLKRKKRFINRIK